MLILCRGVFSVYEAQPLSRIGLFGFIMPATVPRALCHVAVLPPCAPCFPICRVLYCKRPRFARLKAAFWSLKDGLLQRIERQNVTPEVKRRRKSRPMQQCGVINSGMRSVFQCIFKAFYLLRIFIKTINLLSLQLGNMLQSDRAQRCSASPLAGGPRHGLTVTLNLKKL